MTYASEVLADSPALYWKFDETSGTTAVDSAGNSPSRDGQHVNSPAINGASMLGNGSGKSIGYNGSNQYTAVAYASWMNSANFTVGVRHKADAGSLTGSQYLASRWGASAFVWLLYLVSGKVTLAVWTAGSQKTLTCATTLTAGSTYTIEAKYDGANLKVFLNGVVDGTLAETGALNQPTSIPIETARAALAAYGNVDIDEFSFTPTAIADARFPVRHAAAIASGSSASVTPATETDAAQALVKSKSKSVTPATETDAAQALVKSKSKSVTPATETDAPQSVTRGHVRDAIPATETDTPQSLVKSKSKSVTPATETDAPQALVIPSHVFQDVTPATETDTPQALVRSRSLSVTPATETDTPQAITLTTTVSEAVVVATIDSKHGGRIFIPLDAGSYDITMRCSGETDNHSPLSTAVPVVVAPVASSNPDTSGATLAALETEVNELKALLRAAGLLLS